MKYLLRSILLILCNYPTYMNKIIFSILFILLNYSLNAQVDSSYYLDDFVQGTLSVPDGYNSGEMALIISGSGPTDRDGNNSMMKNNSLKMLSDELNKLGIATMRYDKRAIAQSQQANLKEEELSFDTYIQDAKDWIKKLRGDQRFNSISVIGHSEGSQIGIIAAKGIADRVVSIAGPGSPAQELIINQLKERAPILVDESQRIIDKLVRGDTTKNVNPFLASLFRPSVQPYLISWFQHDPAEGISQLEIPVLIIQGDKDIQVKVEDAEKLKAALPSSTLLVIPNMTHVLKIVGEDAGITENMKTYSDPNMPISKDMVLAIAGFINKK